MAAEDAGEEKKEEKKQETTTDSKKTDSEKAASEKESYEESGVVTLEEYEVIPRESRTVEEMIKDDLIIFSPEARDRILKERHLSTLDTRLLNRWNVPFMSGISAEERARMKEEQLRFERESERTEVMLDAIRNSNPDVYKEMKQLHTDRRYERSQKE